MALRKLFKVVIFISICFHVVCIKVSTSLFLICQSVVSLSGLRTPICPALWVFIAGAWLGQGAAQQTYCCN